MSKFAQTTFTMVHDLSKSPSLLHQFVTEVRDQNIQQDRMRFRRNLERVGEVMAYEISKGLSYESKEVRSPLGIADVQSIKDEIVLATILRAGVPFHQGFLNYFDRAESAFVSAFRKYSKEEEFDIQVEYLAAPDLTGKTLIIVDPMLATGASIWNVYKGLLGKGLPSSVHLAALIASRDGINYAKQKFPANTQIWAGAIDDELTAKSYIVPGLGDAGDLAYGPKD